MAVDTVPTSHRRGVGADLLVACVVALILSAGWTIVDWPRLSHLLLPDPDDMMRLAQVRDWLAGQGTNDWTQYRMAPPLGSPMHWSRVNDVGIAGLILGANVFVSRHNAEIFATIAYPALLFGTALFLSARIGRRLWGSAGGATAAILTALAYPGTSIFIPGRIDHHALQAVLIQISVLMLMRRPTVMAGLAAGTVSALSVIVGLETAPQIAALLALVVAFWIASGTPERPRMFGLAGGLGAITAVFLLFLRPTLWTGAYCDAFTPASSTGMLLAAAGFGVLVAATPWLTSAKARIAASAIVGCIVLGITVKAFPACINGPYGAVDPFLRRAFIPFIDEANGLFAQPRIARSIAIGALVLAGCLTTIWAFFRRPDRRTALLPVATVILVSAFVMLFQTRGAYIGAPLTAPVMAGLVQHARDRTRWQLPALIAAWLVSAGMVWMEGAKRVELALTSNPAKISAPAMHVACSVGDTWEQVDRNSTGVVMAGTSVAAYVIGVTHSSTIGAGYHRNNTGNMAMYRFYLSPPDRSLAIAQQWKVDYVLFCPGDFSEIAVTQTFPYSLATQLQRNRPPRWLSRVALSGTPLKLYRVAR